jgi:acyl-CoA reductase-like NAD-dependent aldehyde dehydrogenase
VLLGVAFVIAPWNYPHLTAPNSVVPALLAGNAVILKHSAQTPPRAERMGEAFAAGGLPAGVFQHLHLSHDAAARIIVSGPVDRVNFTGSVAGGRSVREAASQRFLEIGLELGGKDPAYVRPDADLDHAIENLADGAFFNNGQSCCAIERIYVHRDVYDRFVDGLVDFARSYRMDDPTDPATTLGPLVRPAAAEFVRAQIQDAVAAGATAHLQPEAFPRDAPGSAYLAPQVLIDVIADQRAIPALPTILSARKVRYPTRKSHGRAFHG